MASAGNHFIEVVRELCPSGRPRHRHRLVDAVPGSAARMANRPDQFDEAAIDYCVTYEVSPPSWEAPRCRVRMTSGGLTTLSPSSTQRSWPSALESSCTGPLRWSPRPWKALATRWRPASGAPFEALMGQLVGDLTEQLRQAHPRGYWHRHSGADRMPSGLDSVGLHCRGRCAELGPATAQRRTALWWFTEAHRLVAMFFGAMGINEHARIKVKTVCTGALDLGSASLGCASSGLWHWPVAQPGSWLESDPRPHERLPTPLFHGTTILSVCAARRPQASWRLAATAK